MIIFFAGILAFFLNFRREVLSRYCGIARWAENKKRGGENVAILTLLPNFPSIGGCGAALKVAHRYGPIGGKINDAAFSA